MIVVHVGIGFTFHRHPYLDILIANCHCWTSYLLPLALTHLLTPPEVDSVLRHEIKFLN